MLEYREIPGTNIIEFTIDGGITAEEFDGLLARFTAAVEQQGTVMFRGGVSY